MRERRDDPFYKALDTEFEELLLDYAILSIDDQYCGMDTHKAAVIKSLEAFHNRKRVGNRYWPPQYAIDENKMFATIESNSDFFKIESFWISTSSKTKCMANPEVINYWYAFSEPPYGISYGKDEFDKLNNMLFGKELEIYRWNDDFSTYFDDGKEWWGTAMWSIYDKEKNRMVVIGASLTD